MISLFSNNVNVLQTGVISVEGAFNQSGQGQGRTIIESSGASHGGSPGSATNSGSVPSPYGSFNFPSLPGSRGGASTTVSCMLLCY